MIAIGTISFTKNPVPVNEKIKIQAYIVDLKMYGGIFDSSTPYATGVNIDGGTFKPWTTGDVYDAGTF